MKPTPALVSASRLRAVSPDSPNGTRLLEMWRGAIENAARAHAKLEGMPRGPRRTELERKLRTFTARRERTAQQLSSVISKAQTEAIDFEKVAGTVHLTTTPGQPSSGTSAGPLHLGLFPLAFWIVAGAASIVGVYALSRELSQIVVDWTRTFTYIALAGGAAYFLYKLVWGPSRPPPPPRTLGESYA